MANKQWDNNNTGLLKPNDKVQENERAPYLKGSINIEGVEYWASAWLVRNLADKVGEADAEYIQEFFDYIAGVDLSCLLTIKFDKKEQQNAAPSGRRSAPPKAPQMEHAAVSADEPSSKW